MIIDLKKNDFNIPTKPTYTDRSLQNAEPGLSLNHRRNQGEQWMQAHPQAEKKICLT